MQGNECQAEVALFPALDGRGWSLTASKDGQMQSFICQVNSGCFDRVSEGRVEAGRTLEGWCRRERKRDWPVEGRSVMEKSPMRGRGE